MTARFTPRLVLLACLALGVAASCSTSNRDLEQASETIEPYRPPVEVSEVELERMVLSEPICSGRTAIDDCRAEFFPGRLSKVKAVEVASVDGRSGNRSLMVIFFSPALDDTVTDGTEIVATSENGARYVMSKAANGILASVVVSTRDFAVVSIAIGTTLRCDTPSGGMPNNSYNCRKL